MLFLLNVFISVASKHILTFLRLTQITLQSYKRKLDNMENSMIGNWSWIVLKLYRLSFGKLPPVILDLCVNQGTKELFLVARKPKWFLIPWIVLVAFSFLFQLIANPFVLLKCFYDRTRIQLDVLEIVLCLLVCVSCALVFAEFHVYFENWNNVPFLNLMMSNRLGYSKLPQ